MSRHLLSRPGYAQVSLRYKVILGFPSQRQQGTLTSFVCFFCQSLSEYVKIDISYDWIVGSNQRRGFAAHLLIGLAVGLLIGGPLFLIPLAPCPNCRGFGWAGPEIDAWWYEKEHKPPAPLPAHWADHSSVDCYRCFGIGKVTLYNRWTGLKPPRLLLPTMDERP
jgi:hypothetical protein